MKQNERGSIFVVFAVGVWLILFFVGIVGFLLYQKGFLRFEYGPPPTIDEAAPVYDAKTIEQFKQREKDLEKREEELIQKEKKLEAILKQISLEKVSIQQEQQVVQGHLTKISNYFTQFSEKEEADLKQLAQVYENMKPVKVAPILNEMDIETVAELLRRMKSRISAKILAEIGTLNTARAAEISKILKGERETKAFEEAAR